MQAGFVVKSGDAEKNEMELINAHSRRELTADEVYTFSVVLCDNDVDRDFEKFTINALSELAKLYVGKTGIFDHSMKGKDQVARIFSCEVERVEGKLNMLGEPYYRLKARAYMPKSPQNAELILQIDSGIKKEVSVGCAVAESKCSVCGADRKRGGCEHIPGRLYKKNGREAICHTVLDKPTDAYEWSFVAVPAQPLAGVVKSFAQGRRGEALREVNALKSLKTDGEIRLTKSEAEEIIGYIEELKRGADDSQSFRDDLIKSTVSLYTAVQPELSARTLENALSALATREIREVYLSAKKSFAAAAVPQLYSERNHDEKTSNADFII